MGAPGGTVHPQTLGGNPTSATAAPDARNILRARTGLIAVPASPDYVHEKYSPEQIAHAIRRTKGGVAATVGCTSRPGRPSASSRKRRGRRIQDGVERRVTLVKTSPKGNVVVYAVDAIGIIGDATSFPFLRGFYPTAKERGQLFSLKAIGDLGTPDALSFVRGQPPGEDENLKELIDLYTY